MRAAIDAEAMAYALNHYRHGICSTFSSVTDQGKAIIVCIEDHQFQPKNYWFVFKTCVSMLTGRDV